MRIGKVNFPKFNGEDVQGWLYRGEHFFAIDETPDNLKLRHAVIHLEGDVIQWHRSYMKTRNATVAKLPWEEYVRAISSRFSNSMFEDPLEEIASLTHADSTTTIHSMPCSLLDKVREVSRRFFDLSAKEKKECLREDDDLQGYGNDMFLSDDQVLDWTDRLYLTVLPKDQRRLQFWPQNPTDFREVVDEYCSKIELINEVILKAMATSLNLEENCFWDQYGTTAKMIARFNYYPPCQWPDRVLGVKPHGDGSAVTYLLQDIEVEGLQVLKDGQWFGVPIVPDALTINVGDQIELMSNGLFKSPVHQVLVNSNKERMTLAMFCLPQTEKDIGPVDGLITDVTPRLYKNITFSADFFFENYQQGKRPIDACKI
ncbi:protein LATERAL BRANCHING OXIDOREDUCTASE 1-like [Bidens hawaiensis]|uniref:protein LATERAL BRANCHING OXIDOREDUCTASE 1-like n=1 Tax=Bidens hawaiensis TaxID=980011 RepID=UPI004049899E